MGLLPGLTDTSLPPQHVLCPSSDDDVKAAFGALFKMLQSTKAQTIKIGVLGTDVFVQQVLRQYADPSARRDTNLQVILVAAAAAQSRRKRRRRRRRRKGGGGGGGRRKSIYCIFESRREDRRFGERVGERSG